VVTLEEKDPDYFIKFYLKRLCPKLLLGTFIY